MNLAINLLTILVAVTIFFLIMILLNKKDNSEKITRMTFIDFFRPPWRNSKYYIREEAVKQLDNVKILLKIIETDPVESVRVIAIERINSVQPELLVEMARKSADPGTRMHAIAYADPIEPQILIDCFRNDPDVSVRCKAIRRIRDLSILKEAAKDPDEPVRRAAANVTAEALFIKFKREGLVSEMEGEDRGFSTPRSYERAVLDAISLTSDDVLLSAIATLATDREYAYKAIDYITDEKVLIDIYEEENNKKEIRDRARQRLKDRNILVSPIA